MRHKFHTHVEDESRGRLALLHDQLDNLRSERRRYASGVYRVPDDSRRKIIDAIDREIAEVLAAVGNQPQES